MHKGTTVKKNGNKGVTAMPSFVRNTTTNKFTFALNKDTVSTNCWGNVQKLSDDYVCATDDDANGAYELTDVAYAYGSDGVANVSAGGFAGGYYPCYLNRGECNQAVHQRVKYLGSATTLTDCSSGTSDTGQVVVNSDTMGSLDLKLTMNTAIQDAFQACNGDTSGGYACVSLEYLKAEDCNAITHQSAAVFFTATWFFENICVPDSMTVDNTVETSILDLGALMQQALQTDTTSNTTDMGSSIVRAVSLSIGDFNAPTIHDQGDNGLVSGALAATGSYYLKIQMNGVRGRLETACDGIDESFRPSGWSDCGTSVSVIDCFDLTFAQGSNDCASKNATLGTYGSVTSENTEGLYKYNLDFSSCPAGEENCCHSVGVIVGMVTNSQTTCASQAASGRRLSGESRFLQEEEDRRLFGMSYSMAVQTSGADSSEFVGGADPSRVSDSGSSAGWLPAVAVGGLLLLGGAVVAVTRRPSLLRGAFHGPTKVLPNEDN